MFENFIIGSASLFGDPFTIVIFVFGVIGGMLFGAIPGVSKREDDQSTRIAK